MSHVHEGPLATYSSLTDKNLAGYFANTRMRKHLKKAGLVNKRGELVSENQYRLSMARKEHKKHVKNLLAQAIVHKSLDLERTRQVEIRRKLEEIAKIELVRRVRASRGRKGDEEILPYLSPRESRAASRPATASEVRYRPQSAPAPAREAPPEYEETNVIYVDEHGRRLSPDRRDQERPQRGRPEEIDTKHLYSLDSTALKKYALQLARIDQGEVSPYLLSPVPTPPRSSRGSRSGMVGQRLRVRPRTAEARSPYRERPSSGQVQSVSGSSKSSEISPKSTPKGTPRRRFQQQRFVEGTLMLHRQEPAMMHQGEVQTLCEITMKYHGPNLTLPRDQRDPTQAVSIDQQHCGGNTLTVFKENLQPADTFSFISRRHRGFPFSLSIFVDGRIDCRISTCCEYRHAKGVKLGGKMGHFSLLKVKGATPCYKCKLNSQASPRSLKRPPTFKKDKGQPEQMQEEVIVVDKRSVTVTQDEDKYESDFEDEEDTKKENEKYEDEKFEEASSKSSKSSKSSSSSSSSESEPEQDDVDRNSVTHLVYEKKEEKRIIGLKEDEDLEEEKKTEKISVKDTDSVSDVNVPGRKITSYSDDEEYPDGPKYDTTENSNMATKVEKETKERQERSKRRDSSSSRSSSSSSDRKKRDSSSEDEKKVIKVPSPPAEKRKSPSPVLRTRKSSSSSSSSSDGLEKRKKKSPSPVLKKKSSSSSSSSSEDEAKKRKKTPSPTEKRISPIIMEQQRRRGSQSSTSSVHISEAEEEVKKPLPPPQSPPKSPVRSPPRSPLKSPPKSSSSSSASEAEEEKPKEKIIVARTASPDRLGSPARRASPERASSPFPVESFAYKSYAESLPSDDDRRELKRQNSVPDRFAYRRVYENEKNDIVVTATIPVNTKSPSPPLEKRKSPSPPLEKRKSPSPTMEKRKSSSSSSSSSSESEEESKKKPEPQVVEAKKSKSSSSSSSSSESEHEKKVDDKPSAKPEEKKSSSSSSSSDSSSESEKEPEVKKQDVAPEIDRRSPVSQVKADVKKSSSSSSDSSSSESEAEKKVVAKPPSPKLPETLDQVKQKDLSSSGSSSDSSSDSESESDTARTPKQPEVTESQDSPNKTVVSVDVEKQRSPSPPKEEPKDGAAKQSSSSSSSSSGSDSSDSEDEKPKKEEDKAKSPEVKAPSPPPPVVVAPTVVKPEDIKDGGKKPESSSSDDSSSGSSSSDDTSSEDEDNKKKEEEKKDEGQGQQQPRSS